MNRKCLFINPVLVIQRGDFLGSGIPYMPHILAYTIGLLKQKGIDCDVIDAFGSNPNKIRKHGDFYWQGIDINEIIKKINKEVKAIFLYASSITNVDFNLFLIKEIRNLYPKIKIILLANTQAVTSFDIRFLADLFFDSGVNIIVYNDIENTVLSLIENNFSVDKNVIFLEKGDKHVLPMSEEIGITKEFVLPAWEEFPIENYWKLGYSHGPMQDKYLPLLTSYGCPFKCKFCVNPGINQSRWQAKSAEFVFEEMNYLVKKFKVKEFHIEDLDPTIDGSRIRNLCDLIIKNKLKVTWKLVSGTKVETLSKDILFLMEKSGCNYISISPETGSTRVLELMDKHFDFKHANEIIKYGNQIGVKTQACFVIGFPGEKDKDRQKTKRCVYELTKLGIDEIALFIATPLPGSRIFEKIKGYNELSSLTFSPKWRKEYIKLEKFRKNIYKFFIMWKFLYHPIKMFQQGVNFLTRNFKTKMEMIPFRILKFQLLLLVNYGKV